MREGVKIKGLVVNKQKIDLPIIFILLGLFAFNSFVRQMLFPSPLPYQLNLFAFFGCLIIAYYKIYGIRLKVENIWLIFGSIILLCLLMMSEIHAGRMFSGFIKVFVGLVVPLILLYYSIRNKERTIKIVVNVFIVVSLFVVILGVVDLFYGNIIISRFYTLANDLKYTNMALSSSRLYSYLGHPLYNAELFLITFGLNYAYNDIVKKSHKGDIWIILICMVGIALTMSKSAIALYFLMLCVFYIKNIMYLIFSLMITAGAYFFGLFDTVISRFQGSLSTGRNEMWDVVKSSGEVHFHFLWGSGSDSKYSFSFISEWARAAFEYPFRLFSLEFGILFMIIIMVMTFCYPAYKILRGRKRNLVLFVIFVAVSLHVNIYNGIGTYMDSMYMFCLFGCMIMNLYKLRES